MAVLIINFNLLTTISENEGLLSTLSDKLVEALKSTMSEVKLVTSFNVEGSLVNIFTAGGGSVVNLRLFPDGVASFNIDHHQGKETAYDIVQKLESTIKKNVLDIKSTRALPGIKSHESSRYYVTSDCRLLEYDVDEVVFDEVSPFQKVQIVHSLTMGNILVLDDLQNLAESDLVYTETLMQRGKENYKGKSVLILGGGDGALLYELLKEEPKEVIMVEIDNVVMMACAKHMRSVCGTVLDNHQGPNYKIIVDDCMGLLEKYAEEGKKFDYIFGDLTDVPISLDESTELWEFINKVLDLSFKVLQPDGKFMTHVTGTSSQGALESYKKQLEKISPPVKYTLDTAYVPSFYEEWIFCQVSFVNKE